MNWKDLAHDEVSVLHAHATRHIGAGRKLAFPLGGEQAELQVVLTSRGVGSGPPASDLAVHFPDGPVLLSDGRRLMRALSGIDYDPQTGPELRRWLSGAIAASLKSTPFHPASSIDIAPTASLPDPLTTSISLSTRKHRISTTATASAGTWLSLLQASPWKRCTLVPAALRGLSLAVPVILATHELTASDLETIGIGDIILPGKPNFDASGNGTLAIGRSFFRVTYQTPNILRVIDNYA